VRQFTEAVLGNRPGVDLVVLAASELAGNAVLHTASGEPGGQFVVHLAAFADRWQVRVDDAGGPNFPRLCKDAVLDPDCPDSELCDLDLPEAGRGLALVAAVSRNWGVLGDEYSRAVWAEIPHPATGTAAAAGSAAGGTARAIDSTVAALEGDADAGIDRSAFDPEEIRKSEEERDSFGDPTACKRAMNRRVAAAVHIGSRLSLIEIAYSEAFGWRPPERACPGLVDVEPSPSGTNPAWVGVTSDGE
jgi:hypothetical protein